MMAKPNGARGIGSGRQPCSPNAGAGRELDIAMLRTLMISLMVPFLLVLGCSARIPPSAPHSTYGISPSGRVAPPAAGNVRFDRPELALVFDYPKQMTAVLDGITYAVHAGPQSSSGLDVAVAFDQRNAIVVHRQMLRIPITDANLGEYKKEFDDVASHVAGARVSGTDVTAAGRPGLEYDFPYTDIPTAQSRLVFIVDGATEYALTCQSTAAHRAEMASACQTALNTLHFR